MKNLHYDYKFCDIINNIKKCNIKKNDIVYVSGNLSSFGHCETKNINKIPEIFFKALIEVIKKEGTIIVPSHTFFLANTKRIFNIKLSKSISGSFSNYILKQKNVVRQEHPFSSSAAVGKKAKYICSNNTKSVYGLGSPFDRMIKLNAKFLSLGMPINLNCSQVHHAELMMNVPYRYNKKFSHRIKKNNKTYKKDFNMFVLKEQHLKIKRNKNKKIIENFTKKEKIFRSKLGNNFIYSYNLKKFYEINMKLFKKDIFCWVGKKLI